MKLKEMRMTGPAEPHHLFVDDTFQQLVCLVYNNSILLLLLSVLQQLALAFCQVFNRYVYFWQCSNIYLLLLSGLQQAQYK